MMIAMTERFATACAGNVDASLTAANLAFGSAERHAGLGFSVARELAEALTGHVKSMLTVKDTHEVAQAQSAWAQAAMEQALAFTGSAYEIAGETQDEFIKLFESRLAEMNGMTIGLLDHAAKNAPAGADIALSAVKSAMAAANTAYGTMSKAARQATDIAQSRIAAAGAPTRARKAA